MRFCENAAIEFRVGLPHFNAQKILWIIFPLQKILVYFQLLLVLIRPESYRIR